jgi:hypothetical protein
MTKLFISYRREDTEGITGRIYDRLVDHFGKDAVFMDVSTIPYGLDFVDQIQRAVSECDILLAIIGDKWLNIEDRFHEGKRRLDDPGDYVRLEIQAALERNIPVIPVLIGKTAMPGQDVLPADLKALSRRHAATVSTGLDFHIHLDRLIEGIETLLAAHRKSQPQEQLKREHGEQRRQASERDTAAPAKRSPGEAQSPAAGSVAIGANPQAPQRPVQNDKVPTAGKMPVVPANTFVDDAIQESINLGKFWLGGWLKAVWVLFLIMLTVGRTPAVGKSIEESLRGSEFGEVVLFVFSLPGFLVMLGACLAISVLGGVFVALMNRLR